MNMQRKKNPLSTEEALAILEPMTLEERIKAVSEDVDSPEEKFSKIDAFDLARLLGVPQPEKPDNSWSFVIMVEKDDLKTHAYDRGPVSEFANYLEDDVSERRLEELREKFDAYENREIQDFGFLTDEERTLLEDALNEEKLAAARDNGIGCKAAFCLKAGDDELWFEAEIEDDGSCSELRTPYDGANGEAIETTDPHYVYETW